MRRQSRRSGRIRAAGLATRVFSNGHQIVRYPEHNSNAEQRQCGGCPACRGASGPTSSTSGCSQMDAKLLATQNTTQMRGSANARRGPVDPGIRARRRLDPAGCSRMDARIFATQNTTQMRGKLRPIVRDSQPPQAAQVRFRPLGGATHPCEGHDVRLFRLAPLRPCFHHGSPLFQSITAPISGFGLVADRMGERGLAKLG